MLVSTALIFVAGLLIRYYHLPKLGFWSWYFLATPWCMLALGLYTFVVSVYGFLISNRENRCLISLVAVLLTLAFAGQIFSLFTALQLRYVVSAETLPVGAATENMKLYNTDSTVRHNWDAMQRDLRCCGAKNFDTGFTDWRNILQDDVPDSCCHHEEYQCGVDKQRRNKVWTDLQIWRDGCLEILQIKIRSEVLVVLVVYMMVGVAMAVLELVTVAVACAYVAQITRRIRHKTRDMSGASSEDVEDWQSSVSGSLRKDFNFKSKHGHTSEWSPAL
jgi:ABC-type multidrug transport system fused ATPase/permease subunit